MLNKMHRHRLPFCWKPLLFLCDGIATQLRQPKNTKLILKSRPKGRGKFEERFERVLVDGLSFRPPPSHHHFANEVPESY